MLEFDWDEENLNHIARHFVTREEAEYALSHRTLDLGYQDWHEEERFADVGVTALGRFLTLVTTWRDQRLRVVTAYDSSKIQRDSYLKKR